MKRILLVFAVVLSACGCFAKNGNVLRVVSYNVRQCATGEKDPANNWDVRKPASSAMIRETAPDVFGVQEALPVQLQYILENAPEYKCVGVGRDDGKSKGEHMSVFYNTERIELLDWGTWWLSETPDVPSKGWDARCFRTATWTKLRVKATGREFFFVNTHLDHVGIQARLNGLNLIIDKIGEMNPNGVPMILTGDFNMKPDDPKYASIWEALNARMTNSRTAAKKSDTKASYNGWGKRGAIIDYIYFSGMSSCRSFKVIDKQFAGIPYISDHYPVVAELKF